MKKKNKLKIFTSLLSLLLVCVLLTEPVNATTYSAALVEYNPYASSGDTDAKGFSSWDFVADAGKGEGMWFKAKPNKNDTYCAGDPLTQEMAVCNENTRRAVGYTKNGVYFTKASISARVGVSLNYTTKGRRRALFSSIDSKNYGTGFKKCDALLANSEANSAAQCAYHSADLGTKVVATTDDYKGQTFYVGRTKDDDYYTHKLHHGALAQGCFFFDDNDYILLGSNFRKVGNLYYAYILSLSPQAVELRVYNGTNYLTLKPITTGTVTRYYYNGTTFTSERPDSDTLIKSAKSFLGSAAEGPTVVDDAGGSDDEKLSSGAWNPGKFKYVKLTSDINGNISIFVNNKEISFKVTPLPAGSVYFGALSQPCASIADIKISGVSLPDNYAEYYSYDGTYNTKQALTKVMNVSTVEALKYSFKVGNYPGKVPSGYHFTNQYVGSFNTTVGSTHDWSNYTPVKLTAQIAPNPYNIVEIIKKPAAATGNLAYNGVSSTASVIKGRTYATTYNTYVTLSSTLFTLPGWHCTSSWCKSDGAGTLGAAYNTATVRNLIVPAYTPPTTPVTYITHNLVQNQYKTVYNSNPPDYVSGTKSTETETYTYDNVHKLLPKTTFAFPGAVFEYWAKDANGTKYADWDKEKKHNLHTQHNATVNLYAKWRPVKYNVRWCKNNPTASGPDSVTSGTFDYGTNYSATSYAPKYALTTEGEANYTRSDLTTPWKRTGYYIAYWSTKPDGTGRNFYFDSEYPVGGSIEQYFNNLTTEDGGTVELYAIWKPIKYTVVYHSNDSTGNDTIVDVDEVVRQENQYYDAPVQLYSIASLYWLRQNYEGVPSSFMGWNEGSNKTAGLAQDKRQWWDRGHGTDGEIKLTAESNDYVPIWKDNQKAVLNGDERTSCIKRNGEYHIYTVWNDVPIVSCQDYELPYNEDTDVIDGDIKYLVNQGSEVAVSGTKLEEFLLENCSHAYDREEGVYGIGEQRFIRLFLREDLASIEHPTTYEMKYSAKDKQGQLTTKTAKLYGGFKFNILNGTH